MTATNPTEYEVYTAGSPRAMEKVSAPTPKEAALIYLNRHLYKDPVVVEWGWGNNELFTIKELMPDINADELPRRPQMPEPEVKRTWWQRVSLFLFGISTKPARPKF